MAPLYPPDEDSDDDISSASDNDDDVEYPSMADRFNKQLESVGQAPIHLDTHWSVRLRQISSRRFQVVGKMDETNRATGLHLSCPGEC